MSILYYNFCLGVACLLCNTWLLFFKFCFSDFFLIFHLKQMFGGLHGRAVPCHSYFENDFKKTVLFSKLCLKYAVNTLNLLAKIDLQTVAKVLDLLWGYGSDIDWFFFLFEMAELMAAYRHPIAHNVFHCFDMFGTKSAYIVGQPTHILHVILRRIMAVNKAVMVVRCLWLRISMESAVLVERGCWINLRVFQDWR